MSRPTATPHGRRAGLLAVPIIALIAIAGTPGAAHDLITSPYTFADDVLPIVRERCGSCHAEGGVAPMSLLTHQDAVPWGESIRLELMSGHMPPWPLASAPGRFRNVQGLTARELNVLLTWVSGGTPRGEAAPAAPSSATGRAWPLGTPDLVLDLEPFTLGPDEREQVTEFVVPAGDRERWVRAVDLQPGTPAIVRSATISVRSEAASPGGAERLLTLWVPGDHPVAADEGVAFHLPARAELVVRVRYLKTWQYERETMTDRSRVGLYVAAAPADALQALALSSGKETVVGEPLLAHAIYPDPALAHVTASVVAVRPDGTREELIAFRPRSGWARRYWFRQPIPLPRGTRLVVQITPDEGELLPPGALPPPDADIDPASQRITLNVVPRT